MRETTTQVPADRRTTQSAADLAAEWDARVQSWATVCAGPAFQRFRDVVVAEARPFARADAVDIGCGTGLLALALAPRVRHMWAVDVSPGMVEAVDLNAAAGGVSNLMARWGDARALPLPDASVDIAVSCYTLHHLDDEGKREALSEMRRVLRPGGRVVLVDMMFDVTLAGPDRSIIARKAFQLLRKGPGGVIRLARNVGRLARGSWEQPAGLAWWHHAAAETGLTGVSVRRLEQEAGLLIADKA